MIGSLIVKKPTPGNLAIADLGITIPGSGQEEFPDADSMRSVAGSLNIRSFVSSGTLVVNNGSEDLSVNAGLSYLSSIWAFCGFSSVPSSFYKYPFQPTRGRRQWAIQQSDGQVSTVAIGFGTLPTANGTPTAVSDASGQYISYLSNSQINRDAGWTSPTFTQTRRQERPSYVLSIKTGPVAADVQNARIWCGFFSANPIASGALGAIQGCGFRYDTGVDGTAFWRAVTSDGVSSTVTATTVAVAENSAYEFFVDMSESGRVDFYINGVLVASHTTNLPGMTTQLAHTEMLRNITAVARQFLLKRLFMQHL